MIARYEIEHVMRFDYSAPVEFSVMTLYMCPVRDRAQVVREFSIHTEPDGRLFEFDDPFGNVGYFLDRPRAHDRFEVVARSAVEVEAPAPAPERLEAGAAEQLRAAAGSPALWPMTNPSRFVHAARALDAFMAKHDIRPGEDALASARALSARLHDVFEYIPGTTRVDSPIDHILETGRGVCQDYAHVMASILRGWGIPCRYVSGYLGPDAPGAEKCESHAWVECWFPGMGWTGFDPTNDTEGDERHIRVATGRDYADVPPTRGVFRGDVDSELETRVTIERHPESPAF